MNSQFNINTAILEIKDGGIQGALAMVEAIRIDCDESESLDVEFSDVAMIAGEQRFKGEIIADILLRVVGMEGVNIDWKM